MSNIIPLFPLNLVVFPKSRYPLHIFEERYKKMINRCLSENAGFGIVTTIDNELSKIGSYVIISNVFKSGEHGEMDIIVTGVGRFFIKGIEEHPDGYKIAEIEEYNDNQYSVDETMLNEMRNKFEDIIDKIDFQLDKNFWQSYLNASSKTFKLAEKSGLSLKQQQELLTLQNENERIYYLIRHFEELDKKISDNVVLRNIIMNDGYMNSEN